ncbi:hypothetical protein ACVLD2_001790 [Paenibacillus sp. PvR052]|nr:hypothetical protein [Paenibacillus sp. PvP091]MBP1170309.1 hypothetical protein [Paenibacillus sp. PvR098]MBP2441337.1 hypothetical protein [Paenibacillus sp. PvP052]
MQEGKLTKKNLLIGISVAAILTLSVLAYTGD